MLPMHVMCSFLRNLINGLQWYKSVCGFPTNSKQVASHVNVLTACTAWLKAR